MSDPELKIDRAKEHFAELDKEIGIFFGTNPYTVETKRNPNDNRLVYFVSAVKDTPKKLAVITGEVLQSLRSALDNAAYSVVHKGTGGNIPNPRDIYFPIADDAATYNAGKAKKLSGASAAVVAVVDNLQPYAGGNDLLWRVHKLNNIDKHRALVVVGSALRSVDLGAYMMPMMRESQKKLKEAFPEVYTEEMPKFDLSAFFKPAESLARQGLKLLKYVDMGNAFSERSIIAIRNIQRSAIAIGVLYAIGMPLAFGVAQADDAPGLILIYGVIVGAPIVVAVFASVIKKILRSAVDMKSENDLTV